MKKISKSFENCKICVVMLSVFLLSSILGSQAKAECEWVELGGEISYNGGNVGIGTINPVEKLDVVGNIYLGNGTNDTMLRLGGNDYEWQVKKDYADSGKFKIKYLQGNLEALVIDRVGNVGIGATEPRAKLEVNSSSVQGVIINNTSGVGGFMTFQSSGTDQALLGAGATLFTNSGAGIRTGVGVPFSVSTNDSGVPSMVVNTNGNVGIGITNPGSYYKLNIWGKVRAHEIVVNTSGADFVFEDDYELMSLDALEKSIEEKGHLPGIPSAEEIVKNGMSIGEMQTKLLQKVEELTLYVIDQNKKIATLQKENELLKAAVFK